LRLKHKTHTTKRGGISEGLKADSAVGRGKSKVGNLPSDLKRWQKDPKKVEQEWKKSVRGIGSRQTRSVRRERAASRQAGWWVISKRVRGWGGGKYRERRGSKTAKKNGVVRRLRLWLGSNVGRRTGLAGQKGKTGDRGVC